MPHLCVPEGAGLRPQGSVDVGRVSAHYEADRQAFEEQGVRYRVNRRAAGGNKKLSERWRKINRARSRTRARCEHPFRVIKQLWGFDKTRYRGIAKNLARAQTMFALANLYALRHQLMPPGHRCVL
jgi:IS5 family transposase